MESDANQSSRRTLAPRPSSDAVQSAGALTTPMLATSSANPRTGPPRLVTANAGDHALVHALLRAAQQAPSQEEFASWLDEPSYEPSDRLLVKRGDQLVAHLQLLHRSAWFHGVHLPSCGVQDLAILPEYRQVGYDRLLLDAAEHAMRDNQAIVSIVRTDQPEPFRNCGWIEVPVQGYSQASVGRALAHLAAPASPRRRRARSLKIRRWRHVELDAVRRVYRASAEQIWGAIHRSEQYWQWLIGRKAHSDIIVAVDGPDDWYDLDKEANIVGYAVTHGPRVVELCCLPHHHRAAPKLLARACRDAIEQDYHTLSLHVPAGDPLHELIVTAGGSWCADARGTGGTLLVKLLDAGRWIMSIYPLLQRRAKRAGLDRPCDMGFHAGRRRYRLHLTHRSSRLVQDDDVAADVRCAEEVFSALLVGNVHVRRAHEAGQLEIPRPETLRQLAALFPAELVWQSQFDMLRL